MRCCGVRSTRKAPVRLSSKGAKDQGLAHGLFGFRVSDFLRISALGFRISPAARFPAQDVAPPPPPSSPPSRPNPMPAGSPVIGCSMLDVGCWMFSKSRADPPPSAHCLTPSSAVLPVWRVPSRYQSFPPPGPSPRPATASGRPRTMQPRRSTEPHRASDPAPRRAGCGG